jgi:type II secretory pathway component GspD/PulD (secretin)
MKPTGLTMFKNIRWILLLIVFVLSPDFIYGQDVAVIEIKYQNAQDLVPIVQTILSPNGKVTVAHRVNSLVIVDNPNAIQRVHDYLDAFDKPLERVRIRVRFFESRSDAQRSASVDGRVSGKDWSISTDKRNEDGVEVNLEKQQRRRTIVSEYFVTTASGSPAYIKSGQDIPYREDWGHHFRRHGKKRVPLTYKNIETGFEITPRITGDYASLKIVPRIAYDDTETGVIRFHGAQTTIMAPLGQWIEVGGSHGQQNDIINEILTRRRGDETVTLSMALVVEKL